MELGILRHQAEFLQAKDKYLALVGGYRSGKTFCLCLKAIMLSLANKSQPYGAILEPTYGMLKSVLLPTIEPLLEKSGLKYKIFKSHEDMRIELYPPDGVTRTIRLMAYEKHERLVGMSLSWAALDEIDVSKSEIAEAAWQQCASRLTSGEQIQLITSSTPEGFKFLYKFFVSQPEHDPALAKDRKIIRARTMDNPFIRPDYVADIRQRYSAKLAEAYLNGEFVNLTEGQVYTSWDDDKNLFNHTLADYPSLRNLHIGVDFNVGKMAASIGVLVGQKIHIVDEIFGVANTEALILEIKKRYPGFDITCYPDSSGKNGSANANKSSITLLQEAGFKCRYRSTNPRVQDRINSVNAKLKNADGEIGIFVNAEKCPELVRGLRQQGYNPQGEPDKTSNLDHLLDAFGYMVYFNFPLARKPSVSVRAI